MRRATRCYHTNACRFLRQTLSFMALCTLCHHANATQTGNLSTINQIHNANCQYSIPITMYLLSARINNYQICVCGTKAAYFFVWKPYRCKFLHSYVRPCNCLSQSSPKIENLCGTRFLFLFFQFVLSSFFIVSVPFTLSFEQILMSMFILLLTNNNKKRGEKGKNNVHVFPNVRGSFETNN